MLVITPALAHAPLLLLFAALHVSQDVLLHSDVMLLALDNPKTWKLESSDQRGEIMKSLPTLTVFL